MSPVANALASVSLPGTLACMRSPILLAAAAVAITLIIAPTANADPGCGFGYMYECNDQPNGGHEWNGPQRDTWDLPYYGGRTDGPLICDPFSYACKGVAP
jgi:hypothetical protein